MEYKLIVAGGRDFTDSHRLGAELQRLASDELKNYEVSIVSGMARGADALGYQFAQDNSIECYEFPADWDTHGKRAGFKRNEDMAEFADGLLAFWDGKSRGTAHMIVAMQGLGKDTRIIRY